MKLEKYKSSNIIAFINKLTQGFYSKIPTSLTGSFFSGRLGSGKSGLISSLLKKIAFRKRVSTPAKRLIARGFDRSAILGAISDTMKLLPLVQLRAVGLFILGFGAFTAISSLIRQSIGGSITTDSALMLGILSLCTGAILIMSAKSCYQAVRESKIASFLLFRLLGLKSADVYLQQKPMLLNYWAVILGLILGLLGLITDSFTVIALPVIFLILYALLCSPESGVVLTFLLLPVLSGKRLAVLSLFVGLSFLLKLIRGKRTFKFDFTSVTVVMLAVSLFIGGVSSVTPSDSFGVSVTLLALIVSYFVTVNTVKTAVWAKRCCSALLFSFGLTLLTGLTGKVIGAVNVNGVSSLISILPDGATALFSFNSALTVMCVAFMPFLIIGAFLNRTEGSKFVYFCGIAVSFYCIISGSSFGALVSAVFGALLLLLIMKRRSAGLVVIGAVALPASFSLLPSSVIKVIADTVGFSGAEAGLHSETVSDTAEMLRSTLWGGIGLGDEALRRVYPLFSSGSAEPNGYLNLYTALAISLGIAGLLIFAVFAVSVIRRFFSYVSRSKDDAPYLRYTSVAAFTSVLSLTVMGLTDNIFNEPTVFALFFLMTALALSTVAVADGERDVTFEDGPYISLSLSSEKRTVTKGDNDNEQSE